MKVCGTCRVNKNESEFHKNKGRKDGLQGQCKSCAKIRDARSYAESPDRQSKIKSTRDAKRAYNRTMTRRFKKLCGCKFCGEKEVVTLDLHHVNPKEKDKDPSSLYCYSTQRLRDEIRKCIVLCSNCHRKVHAGILKI